MSHRHSRKSEKGAALLTVLLLVAVLAILAAHGIDRIAGAAKLTSNSRELAQAQAYMVAAENLGMETAQKIVEPSPGRTTNLGDWNGRVNQVPVPGGIISATISDGGNCFNINSLVSQEQNIYVARQAGLDQFIRLMGLLDVPQGDALDIAASLVDWLDSDTVALAGGAEDEYYLQSQRAYRTANNLIVDISELRAIKGIDAAIYARLVPWICALPIAELSPVNINTLRPEQSLLLEILSENPVSSVDIRQFLGRRPETGFSSVTEFWSRPLPASFDATPEVQRQVKVATRWFRLDLTVEMQSALIEEQALVDAGLQPARLVQRRRGDAL
ncbi:MAG: type II secretion system minor pseudopilin GspK [Pseudomonadota bacterium]